MPLSGYVYCMRNSNLPGLYKIGFSERTSVRRDFIDRSMRGRVFVLFDQRLMFAYPIEKILHAMFAHIRTTTHGSGKTEWFRPAKSPYLPMAWCLAFWYYLEPIYRSVNYVFPGIDPLTVFICGFLSVVLAQVLAFPVLLRLILWAFFILEISLFFLFFAVIIYFLNKTPIHLH